MQEQVKSVLDNAAELYGRTPLLEWMTDSGHSLSSISLEKKRLYDHSFYKAAVFH
jgi:hypothetical protein